MFDAFHGNEAEPASSNETETGWTDASPTPLFDESGKNSTCTGWTEVVDAEPSSWEVDSWEVDVPGFGVFSGTMLLFVPILIAIMTAAVAMAIQAVAAWPRAIQVFFRRRALATAAAIQAFYRRRT